MYVSRPGDPAEQQADRAAEVVSQGGLARVDRMTSAPGVAREEEGAGGGGPVPRDIQSRIEAERGKGAPLPPREGALLGAQLGGSFSGVRLHTGAAAAGLARDLDARAFTVGQDVFFAQGQPAGRRILAHELAHVVQQGGADPRAGAVVQRQYVDPMQAEDPRPPPGTPPAPNATPCGKVSHCPPGFCDPWPTEFEARRNMMDNWWWIRIGIASKVDSRVLPLWDEFVAGGSSTKDLTGTFGADFMFSPTTRKTVAYLVGELTAALTASPPAFPAGVDIVTLDIPTLIPAAVAAINDPSSPNQMNFNIPADIPGNIAGGIGRNQGACPAGAMPSPFEDQRLVKGVVIVLKLPTGELQGMPIFNFTVKDTIDLCPGDCGTSLEQVATVPLSQWEATGIAGDVPFTVDFAPIPPIFTVPKP